VHLRLRGRGADEADLTETREIYIHDLNSIGGPRPNFANMFSIWKTVTNTPYEPYHITTSLHYCFPIHRLSLCAVGCMASSWITVIGLCFL